MSTPPDRVRRPTVLIARGPVQIDDRQAGLCLVPIPPRDFRCSLDFLLNDRVLGQRGHDWRRALLQVLKLLRFRTGYAVHDGDGKHIAPRRLT